MSCPPQVISAPIIFKKVLPHSHVRPIIFKKVFYIVMSVAVLKKIISNGLIGIDILFSIFIFDSIKLQIIKYIINIKIIALIQYKYI